MDEIRPNTATEDKFKNFKSLIIQGKNDEVLSINYARQSKILLENLKVKNTYFELNIGHTITKESLELIKKWLVTK